MQNTITAQIIGAKRYDIDGNKMASIFVMQQAEQNDNTVGYEVMKVSAPYGVVDQLQKAKLPAEYEIMIKLKAAGGGKMAMVAEGIKPVVSQVTGK